MSNNFYLAVGNQTDSDELRRFWQVQIDGTSDEVHRARLQRFCDQIAFRDLKVDIFVDGNLLFIFVMRCLKDGRAAWEDMHSGAGLAGNAPQVDFPIDVNDGVSVAIACASIVHSFVAAIGEAFETDSEREVFIGNDTVRELFLRDYDVLNLGSFFDRCKGRPPQVRFIQPQIKLFDGFLPDKGSVLNKAYQAQDDAERHGGPVDRRFIDTLERDFLPIERSLEELIGAVRYGLKNECLDTFERMEETTGIKLEKFVSTYRREWMLLEKGVDVSLAIHGVADVIESRPDCVAILAEDRDYIPLVHFWKSRQLPTYLLFCPTRDRQNPTSGLRNLVGDSHVLNVFDSVFRTGERRRTWSSLGIRLTSGQGFRVFLKSMAATSPYVRQMLAESDHGDPLRNPNWLQDSDY